jgi:hypothetical protein
LFGLFSELIISSVRDIHLASTSRDFIASLSRSAMSGMSSSLKKDCTGTCNNEALLLGNIIRKTHVSVV